MNRGNEEQLLETGKTTTLYTINISNSMEGGGGDDHEYDNASGGSDPLPPEVLASEFLEHHPGRRNALLLYPPASSMTKQDPPVVSSSKKEKKKKKMSKEKVNASMAADTAAAGVKTATTASTTRSEKVLVEIDRDFYRSPTILSRLILSHKYPAALNRLKRHPEEAHMWVCAKREGSGKSAYSMRVLPIHMACRNLGEIAAIVGTTTTTDAYAGGAAATTATGSSDSSASSASALTRICDKLNQLITHLVVNYPDACSKQDHTRYLPIQLAVLNGAYSTTVSMLLMAHPESLEARTPDADGGYSLFELNYSRSAAPNTSSNPQQEKTRQLLCLGVEFWKKSRQEAMDRLQQQSRQHQQQQLYDDGRDSGSKVSSSEQQHQQQPPKPRAQSLTKEIEPLSREQLEERNEAMEHLILTEIKEASVKSRLLELLVDDNYELHDKLGQLQQTHLSEQDKNGSLEQLNSDLLEYVVQLERQRLQLLHKYSQDSPTPTSPSAPSSLSITKNRRGGDSSNKLVVELPRSSRTRVMEDNKKLLGEMDSLHKLFKDLNRNFQNQQERFNGLVTTIRQLEVDSGVDAANGITNKYTSKNSNSKPGSRSSVSSISLHSETSGSYAKDRKCQEAYSKQREQQQQRLQTLRGLLAQNPFGEVTQDNSRSNRNQANDDNIQLSATQITANIGSSSSSSTSSIISSNSSSSSSSS